MGMAVVSCGLGSRIPLRGQLAILLIVCGVFFLVLAPAGMELTRMEIGISFEVDVARANLNRGMAAMDKALLHEEVCTTPDNRQSR